jgi:thiol-disulfide isomerase/thioredoxin
MAENDANQKRPLVVLLVIGAIAILLAIVVRRGIAPEKRGGLEPGNKFPPIFAEGWLNGPTPTAETFRGKVLVVDAWATWCLNCRKEAPALIELQRKFADRDVVFFGLTNEDASLLPLMREYLETTGIPWLNGYGAVKTLIALKADYIPCHWVVDRTGTIVWNDDSGGEMEEAIEKALAKPR